MTNAERKLLMTLAQTVLTSQLGPADMRSRVAGLMADIEREAGIAPSHWFHDQTMEKVVG